ncbi:Terrein cluster-specific transcription factor terR [Colletotrichum viniferum]|nr:Terrein cluster-specific transcription factor terR [Colletotrichum viniferum]
MYSPNEGCLDLEYGPPLGAGADYRNFITTHPQLLSVPRPLTAGIAGSRSEILQLNGCNRGLQQGYYQGELSDGPACQFPLPFAVNEASAANAPDSSDLHIDVIQEEQANLWGNSKPLERANSALSSAGSLDDDMEWAVDLGWITSEAGTPSQFLESSVTAVVDDLEKPISHKASHIVSPANTQQPTDIVLANDTKSESSAGVTAPLSPSSPGRPRISASSQSFYGLRDAVCRLLGNNQQDIARALSVSEDKTPNSSRTANPVPAGESDSYDGSWWMLESDAALQAYIAAFSDYFYSFIPKANIEARLKEARLPDASHLVRGFASAVIALGAYYHRQHGFTVVANYSTQKQQQKKRLSSSHNADGGHLEDARASWRLRAALAFRGCVRGLPSQLLKLQASIASECDIPSLVTENVAIAAMHVRELDLAQIDADDEESVLSSAYSYVLDVSYALNRGAPPTLDCDWIDGSDPLSHSSEGDLLGIRSLAAVMHRCLRRQFSPRASHTYSSATVSTGGGRWQSHQKSQEQLRYWVELFPDLNLRITPGNNGCLPTSTARMAFCMYHRAVFLTHCPWIVTAADIHSEPIPEHGGVGDQDALGHGCCIRACLESAQQVIDAIPCFFSQSSCGTRLERYAKRPKFIDLLRR